MENNKTFWPGWETVSRIGSGGFGTVYEIQRDVYGDLEKAALKVITIPHSEDEVDYLRCTGLTDDNITQTLHKQVADIAREYKLMAQMRDNPNVVRCDDFRDIQHEDGLGWDIYIKMELLTPLMKCLDKVQTEEQILKLGVDICNALIACQEKNIIHRDIKPQNIFISEKGQFKLGDFGIARTAERTTRATAGIGTYSYMAPEVEKNEAYGKTADIYSLGLVLYWLLNEKRSPFLPLPPEVPGYGDEENARNRRFHGEQIPAPQNGSEDLKAIVLKACAYDPKERFQSAQEMLQALETAHTSKVSAIEDVAATNPASVEETVIGEELTVGTGWSNTAEKPVEEDNATVGPTWYTLSASEKPIVAKDLTVGPKWSTPAKKSAVDEALTVEAVGQDARTTKNGIQDGNRDCHNYSSSTDISQNEITENSAADTVLIAGRKNQVSVSKKRRIMLALFLIFCAAITVLVFWPIYGDWSEWQMNAPEESRKIKMEAATWYRFREKTTMIVEDEEVTNGVLLNQWEEWSEYSDWSEWQEEPVEANEMCDVESETLYRERNIITKEEYADWSSWSKWSTNKASASDTKEVETRKVYYYDVFSYYCKTCGYTSGKVTINMVIHAQKHGCSDDALTALSQYLTSKELPDGVSFSKMLSNVNFKYKQDTISSVEKKLSVDTSTNPYSLTNSGTKWFVSSSKPSKTNTQYRYRTRKLETTKTYTEWSEFTNKVLTADKKTEVETIERFRFRTRDRIIKYEYEVWSEWSDWQSEQITRTDAVQVEQCTFYRFAKRYFLIEKLLGKLD